MATIQSAVFSDRLRSFSKTLELDTRLLSMIAALLVVWLFFDYVSGGIFLSPRNLWNLSVQTSVTALIATGMVLIIVSRNIDLSVGSLLAFLGIMGAFLQTEILPLEGPHTWWLAIVFMIVAGGVLGGVQGFIIAQFSIPAFVVTLGGLMFWRGAGWLFTQGRTVTPLDTTFNVIGGGSIGEFWSWVAGAVAFVLLCVFTFWKRSSRGNLGFAIKPLWLE
ncbi:MAG: ABC transporter permease subunit, partial [Geminicoccaceae bacterium]